MPVTVLSWNCCGGDIQKLDNFVTAQTPDIVVLQETPTTIQSSALATNKYVQQIGGPVPPYLAMTVLEFPQSGIQRQGGSLHVSGIKLNFIMVRRATLNLTSFALLDYTTDANAPMPANVNKARDAGFETRPPAVAQITINTGGTIAVFCWHAPVGGQYHQPALSNFDRSATLSNRVANCNVTIIAGDLNDQNVSGYFTGFFGLQQKYDYIIAATPGPKAAKVNNVGVSTSALTTKSGDHEAVFARIG